ncbi:hypothetical protein NDN08_005500 [Rhodosorus marinus]|uniref:Uncharacterized protein n=1 Tax=Rhodosorus marinus TaxID=101924 RepID=A0AAV8V1S8_9RHOD|nr:hypothetical protein NDN08_005500 [Rhodosorus marinus]
MQVAEGTRTGKYLMWMITLTSEKIEKKRQRFLPFDVRRWSFFESACKCFTFAVTQSVKSVTQWRISVSVAGRTCKNTKHRQASAIVHDVIQTEPSGSLYKS